MIELTSGAENRLNHYLNEVRRTLAGSTSVDPEEVERDIRDHVEAALAGRPVPVDSSAVDDVLTKLGSPSQWMPESDVSPGVWSPAETLASLKESARQIAQQLAKGPESFRLAYLSLFSLAFGWLILCSIDDGDGFFVFLVAVVVSFILSRAALSMFGIGNLSTSQKWLLYPALLTVYIPIALLLLIGPIVAVTGLFINEVEAAHRLRGQQSKREAEELDAKIRELTKKLAEAERVMSITSPSVEQMKRDLAEQIAQREAASLRRPVNSPYAVYQGVSFTPVVIVCALLALVGVNWLFVGGLAAAFPGAVRNVFHPFADRFTRGRGLVLMLVGMFLSLGGMVFVG